MSKPVDDFPFESEAALLALVDEAEEEEDDDLKALIDGEFDDFDEGYNQYIFGADPADLSD